MGKEEDFDWQIYKNHKKVIDRICCGDIELYTWAIKELTEN
jgi:hypothetical protein